MTKTKEKFGNKPLFTDKELATHQKKLENKQAYEDRKALKEALKITRARRAQARPDEFLNGLLTLTGTQGGQYLTFDWAFNYKEAPDASEVEELVTKCDNPESRRALYTILKSLTEVPKSWGLSAFVRFLRGTGKQKGAKYHGAGMFSAVYGWKEREVKSIADIIVGDRWDMGGNYCKTLMRYADVESEINEANRAYEDGISDYEVVDYDVKFYATRVERDVDFINKLCKILEERGLGPVPTPAAAKPKKVRKPKEYKSGDVIRKTTLRDLPLPAHVRLNIQKYDKDSEQWLDDTLEQVVTSLTNYGQYHCHYVMPGTKRAYPENIRYSVGEYKERLYGATYLGPWEGQLVKTKEMKLNFRWKKRENG